MNDLSGAVVLGLVVVGLVSWARTMIEGPNKSRLISGVCLVVGVVAVLLVGASDWSHEQVVLNKSLDSLNFWSQLLLGVLVGGFASGSWETLRAVKNIGDNQSEVPPSG